jgi:hypothetical protein
MAKTATTALWTVILLIGAAFIIYGAVGIFSPFIPFGSIGMFVGGVILIVIAAVAGYSLLKTGRCR